jgi:tetratricopeptide (TPR) repeat protein
VHEHFTEEELARYATDPESVPAHRRRTIEQESASCAVCRTSLDFFSVVTAEDLADVELWEPDAAWTDDDDPMRAYIERIAAEDEEADRLLAEMKLLESPMKTAWKDLPRDKRMLTGGIVRRLVARANAVHLQEPLDALTFADGAISIAESLVDDAYPWKAVFELRGAAWKERANALLVLGDYPPALDALVHADRSYRELSAPGLGLATVALLRASVFYEQGQLDEAAKSAEKAERGFSLIGQEERCARALFLRASIHYEGGNIATALILFRQVLDRYEDTENIEWIGRSSYAIGNCEVDRGNLAEASLYFHKSLVIFRETGADRERVKTEWGLARVVLHGGNRIEAIRRLRAVASELERRSLLSDAALVRLDIVEALLALGEAEEIAQLCGRLFRVFKKAGMITGALTAIAYLREAASAGRLTPSGVDAVRRYLRRAETQPQLLFERPPDIFR